MYLRDFAEMSDQLHFTPSTAQRKFTAVIEELFSDGVNWGRIVAFFEFGGTMCVESVNREMTSQVDNIAHWMTEYLNGPLHIWIQENGGWHAGSDCLRGPDWLTLLATYTWLLWCGFEWESEWKLPCFLCSETRRVSVCGRPLDATQAPLRAQEQVWTMRCNPHLTATAKRICDRGKP
ncbi:hypothetical protein SKAU_G00063920 [Synaphobranchus kaupii]|uniref:Bcl-2 Bcl-2 homology region 1-3 domain-containing protein n=1 Tax=Synaphobranchus kaupii TaxID=118154 RepID=A0A9Q1JB18_SYNKA|nr:hypothetical protein SKAU_G00063920 [Synaphobranchus kaupii]